MTTLIPLLSLLFSIIFHHTSGSNQIDAPCPPAYCGGIQIKFPFTLRGGGIQTLICNRRSYPNFIVTCDNQSQALLSLPNSSGDLLINGIDYASQVLLVNDPSQCLPRRFLQNRLDLSSSPFEFAPVVYNLIDLTFLRCPYNLTQNRLLTPVHCLSDLANSSFAVTYLWLRRIPSFLNDSCEVINSSVPYPISNVDPWPFWVDIGHDLQLTWRRPRCGRCEAQGQDCGFAGDAGLRTKCFTRPQERSGLPRGVKYGLTIGVGIPGLLCLIGLACFMCGTIRRRRNLRPNIDLPLTSFAFQSGPFQMGLDGSTIEKYPMTLLGESKRLPKPNDNTCSICLSEYEPKEILRTIPDCNHYFHAHCIDEWLRMNATCPVCRNSPTLTPSSTFTSSSASSGSPPSTVSSSH